MKRGDAHLREFALQFAGQDLGKGADVREILQRAQKYRDFLSPDLDDEFGSPKMQPLLYARLDLGLTVDGLDADVETVIERAQKYMEFMLENPDATVAKICIFPHSVPNDGPDQGGVL